MFPTMPIKCASRCNSEVLAEGTNPLYEIEYVDIGSVTSNGDITSEAMLFGEAPSRARRKVRDGDVIVSTVRTYLRAIAHLSNPPENMVVSTGFAVLRPSENVDTRFFGYALQSNTFVNEVVAKSEGVSYPAITPQKLAGIRIPVPPKPAQVAIAEFLDRETATADTLISDHEIFINLLVEKRTVAIKCAVTKGVDPNATAKDSGVAWIGQVPTHWTVRPLQHLGIMVSGGTPPDAALGVQGDVPFYRVADLGYADNDGNLTEPDVFMTSASARSFNIRIFPAGTVIFAKRGAALLLGRVRRTPSAACVDTNMMGFEPEPRLLNSHFAQFAMQCIDMSSIVNPGALPSVDARQLKPIRIPVPPLGEQEAIVDRIKTQTREIDELISDARRSISLLSERRAALVTAAVTGEINLTDYNSRFAKLEIA
jgi:type I restriction enzyme S subunit